MRNEGIIIEHQRKKSLEWILVALQCLSLQMIECNKTPTILIALTQTPSVGEAISKPLKGVL